MAAPLLVWQQYLINGVFRPVGRVIFSPVGDLLFCIAKKEGKKATGASAINFGP